MKLLNIINSITLVPPSEYNSVGVFIEKTHHQKESLCWAVRMSGSCLNKVDNLFVYETSPSNRDENHYQEHRFNSPKEAALAFKDWLASPKAKEFTNPKVLEYFKENFDESILKLL